jgi:hypothetical protein
MDQLYITKLQLAEIQSLPANRSGVFFFIFSMIKIKVLLCHLSETLVTRMEASANSRQLNLTAFTVYRMSGTVLFPVQDVKELISELQQQIQEIEAPLDADS